MNPSQGKYRMRVLHGVAIAVAAVVSACSTTVPTQFYTLLPAAKDAAVAAGSASFEIDVLPVDVPAQVDRPQIVVRQGAGQLVPVETRQWIAPLGAEIRGALAAELSRTLGARDVDGLSPTPGLPLYRIRLKVERFESAPGAYARIDASWSVQREGQAKGGLACSSGASEVVAPGYSALAEGHQRALEGIAHQIAQVVIAMATDKSAAACPTVPAAPG